MFALPVLRVLPNNTHIFYQGLLHQLPPELTGEKRFSTFKHANKAGWHKTEFGYYSYCVAATQGGLYIFPALYLIDQEPPSKKFYGYKKVFTKVQIENYAAGIVKREDNEQKNLQIQLNSFVHDLRKLSTAIYHQSFEAKNIIPGKSKRLRYLIDSIMASQTMLKIRTDVMDVSGGVIPTSKTRVPIYKKTDKVVKCFRPMASDRDIEIILTGKSHSTGKGPKAFEIVPYILIENAVKYSNKGQDISVNFMENAVNIVCEVISKGPSLIDGEQDTIFKKGFRGANAVKSGVPGSGLGLHLAKDIVQLFDGNIIHQETEKQADLLGNFRSTHKFIVTVPKAI